MLLLSFFKRSWAATFVFVFSVSCAVGQGVGGSRDTAGSRSRNSDSVHSLRGDPSYATSDYYQVSRTDYKGNYTATYIMNNGSDYTGSIALCTSGRVGLDVRPNGEVQIVHGGRNDDPLLVLPKSSGWNRISAAGSLELAAGNRVYNDDKPDLMIGMDGNVGIGTGINPPTYKFQVNGDIFTSSRIYSPALGLTGSNGTITTAGTLTVATNRTSSGIIVDLFIDGNDNVGIGTTLPKTKLHVKGAITSELAPGVFIGTAVQGTRAFMGTTSDADLLIGSNQKPAMLVSDDNRYVNLFLNKPMPAISEANKNKYGLFVSKGILSEEYAIGPANSWADYVFRRGYALMPLDSVEAYIREHGHLSGVPAAGTVEKEGYSLHEMNVRFLAKIEELTLYTIEQKKELDGQREELKRQGQEIEQLRAMVERLAAGRLAAERRDAEAGSGR